MEHQLLPRLRGAEQNEVRVTDPSLGSGLAHLRLERSLAGCGLGGHLIIQPGIAAAWRIQVASGFSSKSSLSMWT